MFLDVFEGCQGLFLTVAKEVGGQREAFTKTLDRISDRNMLTRSTFGLDSYRISIH